MKNNIFISGCEGLIATEFIRQLELKGHTIVNKSSLFNKYRTFNAYTYNSQFMFKNKNRKLEIDVRNFKLFDVFKKIKVDLIIHISAFVNTCKCENNLEGAIDNNIKATYNLVNIAKILNIPFVNFSTTATFDTSKYNGEDILLDEFTARKPRTTYGMTKLLSENIVKMNLENYINFLPVFIYGTYPVDNSSELVKIIYNTIKKGKNIKVKLSLDNYKNYFPVESAVDAMIRIIFNPLSWQTDNKDFVIANDVDNKKKYSYYVDSIKWLLDVKKVKADFLPEYDYLHNHIGDNTKMQNFAIGWVAPSIEDNYKKIQEIIGRIKNAL